MSYLVIWSICWSSSLVHFKNSPKYLSRGTTQVLIPLIRFLLCSLVLSSILILMSYSFFFFFLSPQHVWWLPLPVFLSICNFPFLWAFWFFLNRVVLLFSIIYCFPLFLTSMAHFSMLNSIPDFWLCILTACIRVFDSFNIFANNLMFMYMRFFLRFMMLVSACAFPKYVTEWCYHDYK